MHVRPLWPTERAAEIRRSVQRLADLSSLRWTFVVGDGRDILNYVQPETHADFAGLGGHQFLKPETTEDWASLDVILVTAHGSDLAASLAGLRAKAPGAVIALWMWDNHVGHVGNLQSVTAADFYFPSHRYITDYLPNPASINGGHIPLCSAQWAKANAARLFDAGAGAPRDGRMLVNYVDYNWSWRSELIKKVRENITEAAVITMPPNDRSRYFLKSSAERFQEWLGYKSTLILPLDSDLSTRVFDALLAGLVPIVPRKVLDFDIVIPPAEQQRLGIVRVDDFEVETLRQAAIEADRLFDAMGDAGARARHDEARNRHMIADRFLDMINAMRRAGSPEFSVVYGALDKQRPALHIIHAQR